MKDLCTWTDGDDEAAEWWYCHLNGQNFLYVDEYKLKVPSMMLHALRNIPTNIVARPQSSHTYRATDTSMVATVLIKCTA